MTWKSNKNTLDLEKAIGADTTSSFGSVKHNVIVIPEKAYSKGSPTETNFEQSGTSSPGFTSSFPTSEERQRKMKTFVMRHAFILLVAVMFLVAGGITTLIILLRGRYKLVNASTDQLTQTITAPPAVPFPTFTRVITSTVA